MTIRQSADDLVQLRATARRNRGDLEWARIARDAEVLLRRLDRLSAWARALAAGDFDRADRALAEEAALAAPRRPKRKAAPAVLPFRRP